MLVEMQFLRSKYIKKTDAFVMVKIAKINPIPNKIKSWVFRWKSGDEIGLFNSETAFIIN
jgi:hypothetical protein